MRYKLSVLSIMLVVLAVFANELRAEQPSKNPPSQEESAEKPWEFDQSLYTNSPKTGERTDQYEKPKAAYRDPNSWFDSPHMSYPFDGTFTVEPYDVFPYPYYPGPNAEHPSYAPDPYTPEQSEE